MIKTYLSIIFIVVQFEHISAVSNTNIYFELYSFLAQVQDGTPELDPEINVKDQLFIYDVLDSCQMRIEINQQEPFKVFKFNYLCDDCDYCVMIKLDSTYHIYNERNINGILIKLIEIRNLRPDLLTDNLFFKYLKELTIPNRMDVIKHFGQLNYYFELRDK